MVVGVSVGEVVGLPVGLWLPVGVPELLELAVGGLDGSVEVGDSFGVCLGTDTGASASFFGADPLLVVRAVRSPEELVPLLELRSLPEALPPLVRGVRGESSLLRVFLLLSVSEFFESPVRFALLVSELCCVFAAPCVFVDPCVESELRPFPEAGVV